MEPGIYEGLSNADYHGGAGVSKSQLDLIEAAPALLVWSKNVKSDNGESSKAIKAGNALHSLILEPNSFSSGYVVEPEISGNSKLARERREEFKQEAAGRIILSTEEWEVLQRQRDSVLAHPEARALLGIKGGMAEASAYWVDDDTGLLCRCRPDWWPLPELIVDLKSTDDPSPRAFSYSIRDYRYHVQDSFYSDGAKSITRTKVEDFVFIVVGKKRELGRYPVRVYRLDQEAKDAGRKAYKENLNTLAECYRSREFPGVETIGLPKLQKRYF